MTDTLLHVDNLSLRFTNSPRDHYAVNALNFSIIKGKTLALVGESGCGKSMTALSIMRLLPKKARFSAKSAIHFSNQNLLLLPEHAMRRVRGNDIAMIFQEPMTALNPVMTIRQQLTESLRCHSNHCLSEEERLLSLLHEVGIADPIARLNAYPHQLSGGMKQRVLIAMALALEPQLLIADEPTTALDVTLQAQILQLLKSIQVKRQLTILLITHDLAVVQQFADNIAVMRKGSIVETNSVRDFFKQPKHTYSQQLLNALPEHLQPIAMTPMIESATPLLKVDQLVVNFTIKNQWWEKNKILRAVQPTSFTLSAGKTLALVGESGCGKTTLAKAIMQLIPITSGDVEIAGQSFTRSSNEKRQSIAKKIQMVFQDPFSAMDPRFTVLDIIAEGLLAQNDAGFEKSHIVERVLKVLEQVGLPLDILDRYPHEFSGGQRQRIAIARALILEPSILICDEPTSALDVSVQAQILQLLAKIQQSHRMAYLLITHNIGVVGYLADTVAVMYLGRIVEMGPVDNILKEPQHPYTKALLASVPKIDGPLLSDTVVHGELPSPMNPPSGCAFHPRCPLAQNICRETSPEMTSCGAEHHVACWAVTDYSKKDL